MVDLRSPLPFYREIRGSLTPRSFSPPENTELEFTPFAESKRQGEPFAVKSPYLSF